MKANKKNKSVILRADGNSTIGLGHVYRLLALAEMLKDDFDCSFAINEPDSFTLEQIEKICKVCIQLKSKVTYHLPDLNKPGEEIDFDLTGYLTGNEIVVTDGYLFGEKYQLAVKDTGAKLVCIDDLAETFFYADVIINHAPGIDPLDYKKQKYTQLYSGLNYALLRQPFFKPLVEKKYSSAKVFISLGGSDYFGYSKKLLELLLALNQFESLEVLCLSTFDTELLKSLKELEADSEKIKLHFNLDANKLVEILDRCTHAFVAASTVLIEAYARGLKCFAGFYTKNQQFIYKGFIAEQLAIGLENFETLDFIKISKAFSKADELHQLKQSFNAQGKIRSLFNLL